MYREIEEKIEQEIKIEEVEDALGRLKKGKSTGWDELQDENLKYRADGGKQHNKWGKRGN